ncbi:hypothetical protein BMS3Abin02_02268 [bacterium BMS3Abin02]|nr:hypothetical protein BMS3Abin02_02268 [bacterium BMS3Abin02]GBE22376.1 hypothetical protein BMS3Bbin01_01750 [bacterium BMS3Bbin01]HDH26182.1 hypothetical protein [Actinomycetota bacterium]HDL49965.1 hypothetical protein [Actinomycetota bacterium]
MKRVVVATLVVAVVVTGILFWFSGFMEAAAYEVLLGVVAVAGLVALRTSAPISRPAIGSRTRRRAVPPQLERLERVVRFGTSTATDADRRLYRVLREQARELLLSRYGVDLDAEPEEARRLLGDDAWERIRPDRPVSKDRLGPGAELSEVDMVVGAIERLIGR